MSLTARRVLLTVLLSVIAGSSLLLGVPSASSAQQASRDSLQAALQTHMDRGAWDDAIRTARLALGRDPDDLAVYPWFAGALWRSGHLDEAMDVFTSWFPRMEPDERALYSDLGLVLDAEEQKTWSGLDDAGRRAWWDRYWAMRDPDPRTPLNERLLEHYVRIAWARLQYSSVSWPWDVRGALFVRYGPPDIEDRPGHPVDWEGEVLNDPTMYHNRLEFVRQMGLSTESVRPPAGVDAGAGTASMLQQRSDVTAIRQDRVRWERWAYRDRGIVLTMFDDVGRGRYLTNDFDNSSQTVEVMERRLPVLSAEEEKIATFDPMDLVVTFKGTGGRTRVTYLYAMDPTVVRPGSGAGGLPPISSDVAAFSDTWEPLDRVRSRADPEARVDASDYLPRIWLGDTLYSVDASSVEVPAGPIILTTLLEDPVSGLRSSIQESMTVPDYSGPSLAVSDILPAARVTPAGPRSLPRFVHDGQEVIPLPRAAVEADRSFYVYFEVYNLAKDEVGGTEWEVAYTVGESAEDPGLIGQLYQGLRSLAGRRPRRARITSRQTYTGIHPDVSTWLSIDLGALEPGPYELRITATDRVSGATATSQLLFRTLPAP